MAGYRSPRWCGKGPMAVKPTGIASCHNMPGAHSHKLGGAGEWPHMGRATGPPEPQAHSGDPGRNFGHNTVSPATLGSGTVTAEQHFTQPDTPKSGSPLSAMAQVLQDLLTTPSREPVGLGLGWKGRNRHSERWTLPPFSPAPIPEQSWAAWSLPTPQLSGITSNPGWDIPDSGRHGTAGGDGGLWQCPKG